MTSNKRRVFLFVLPALCLHALLTYAYQTQIVPQHRVSKHDGVPLVGRAT